MERKLFFFFAVTFTTAIAIGSFLSVENSVQIKIHAFDKVVHIGAYGVLTLSWLLAFKDKAQQLKFTLLIASLVFVYGIIIEVLQESLTWSRQADTYDLFANLIGIILAFLFFKTVLPKKKMN